MRETEPKTIKQGETLAWTKHFSVYSPSDYSLDYYFRGVGAGFDVAATNGGADFLISVASSVTLALAVGDYVWQAWLTKDDEKILAAEGKLTVEAGLLSLAATAVIETRSQAEIDLQAVREMLSGKAAKDVQEYAIGNRQLKHIPIADLLALQKDLVVRVNQERIKAKIKSGGKLLKSRPIRHYGER